MSFIICWKYENKSGRGDKKYPTKEAARAAIKTLNPSISYWVEDAEHNVQRTCSSCGGVEFGTNDGQYLCYSCGTPASR